MVWQYWFSFYLTESLRCLKYIIEANLSVSCVWGVKCDVSLMGNFTVVFVTEDDEYVVELKDVLYAPDLGYKIFAPSVGFDYESWDRLGSPDRVLTAFNGGVTLIKMVC